MCGFEFLNFGFVVFSEFVDLILFVLFVGGQSLVELLDDFVKLLFLLLAFFNSFDGMVLFVLFLYDELLQKHDFLIPFIDLILNLFQ